jgi:oxygen-independent coproporphyrinogen-3 oxidase
MERLSATFDVDGSAEITLEANPDDISGTIVREYMHAGINRISIGAQSFDDSELCMLARRHDSAGVLNAVKDIRDAGLENFSLDLIYGIPGQSTESWKKNIDAALALSPKHISAYCLTVEKGTPLHTSVREGELVLPPEETLRAMYLAAVGSFEHAGLIQYELSNFAISDYESRHNLAYWTGKPYLGFGPAASSYLPPRRWTNVANLDRYIEMIRDSGRAVDYDEDLGDDLLRLEYIMLSLRLKRGLNVAEYKTMFRQNIEQVYGEQIRMLMDAGLMVQSDGFLKLTPEGMFMSDAIITNLA